VYEPRFIRVLRSAVREHVKITCIALPFPSRRGMISNFVRRHTSCDVRCPTLSRPVIKITYVSNIRKDKTDYTQSKSNCADNSIDGPWRREECRIQF
jgi:hypothetical protein